MRRSVGPGPETIPNGHIGTRNLYGHAACRNLLGRRSAHNIRAVSATPVPRVTRSRECRSTATEIAALIRHAREDRGLTQRELGDLMGKKQPEVARWESGDHTPSMTTLGRIADALEVELTVHFGPQATS